MHSGVSTWLSLALLAVGVSVDGFGAGLAYGLRRIGLDAAKAWSIGVLSGAMVFFLGTAGRALAGTLGLEAARVIGALVLIGLGGWRFWEYRRSSRVETADGDALAAENGTQSPPVALAPHESLASLATVWSVRLRPLGLIIQVLREPASADLDHSGWISWPEAVLLGVALSLDAAGVGLGAGMAGFAPAPTAAAVVLANVAFLYVGTWSGRRVAHQGGRLVALTGVLPSLILVGMGLSRLA